MWPHGAGLCCAGFRGGGLHGVRLRGMWLRGAGLCGIRLRGIQILLQRIQAGIPKFPVLPYPIRYFVQFVQSCLAISFATLLADNDKPAFGQYLNMFVDGGAAHIEITRHGVDI